MHVALIHHHVGGKAGGGGGVRLMLELGLGLVRRGHQVTVACHDYLPGSEFSYASEHLEIRAVRHGVSDVPEGSLAVTRRNWLDMPKVARLVPQSADLVHAHEGFGLRPGHIAARRLSIPLVWNRNDETRWERAIVPEQTNIGDPRLSRRVMRMALSWPDLLGARRADAIVVLSKPQVDMVRRSYRKDAFVVPFGPPEQFFDSPDRDAARARLGIPDEAFLVLSSGILAHTRRFEDLVQALGILGNEPSIRGLIMGSDHYDPAYSNRLARMITELGLTNRVSLHRRSASDSELKDIYAAADVFVISSQHYSWGLAPLEAIAAGTPVILTPGAGVHDILAGRPGIQVVPPRDPDALASAIMTWRSGSGRKEIEPTRTWLRDELSSDKYAERMEQIYLAARRARNGRR